MLAKKISKTPIQDVLESHRTPLVKPKAYHVSHGSRLQIRMLKGRIRLFWDMFGGGRYQDENTVQGANRGGRKFAFRLSCIGIYKE